MFISDKLLGNNTQLWNNLRSGDSWFLVICKKFLPFMYAESITISFKDILLMQTTRVNYRRQFRNEILNFFMRNCSFRRVRFGRILYIHGRCQSSAPHCHCCLCWMHWKTPSPRERQAMRMSVSSWLRAPLTRQPTIDSVVVVGWLGLWRLYPLRDRPRPTYLLVYSAHQYFIAVYVLIERCDSSCL